MLRVHVVQVSHVEESLNHGIGPTWTPVGNPKVEIDVAKAPILASCLLVQLRSCLGQALAVLNSYSINRLVRKSGARVA